MPIYEYTTDNTGCELCSGRFDRLQKIADPALAVCPQCGIAVHRVISAPQVISGQAHKMKEDHIAKNGFTQYKRAGSGVYEKTVGKGPDYISDN
jgi:putative FmdB family regulatory protein